MKRLATIAADLDGVMEIDEDGNMVRVRLAVVGGVTISADVKLTPEAAIVASRALAKFAMRHLPDSAAEISDGVPTMSPEFDTTAVGTPPTPSRVSG